MSLWPGQCPELGCGLQLTPSRGMARQADEHGTVSLEENV